MTNDKMLSEHFSLSEMTKTQYVTKDGNIPSRVAIENLRNLCENWLEDLRYSYNTLSHNRDSPHCANFCAARTKGTVPCVRFGRSEFTDVFAA